MDALSRGILRLHARSTMMADVIDVMAGVLVSIGTFVPLPLPLPLLLLLLSLHVMRKIGPCF